MKEYNRTTKKYEEATDIKLKKRELCRGGREHDYVLVLPDHVNYNETYKFNPEKYYELVDKQSDLEDKLNTELAEMGIVNRFGSVRLAWRARKCFMCSVCKKKKYE